MTDDHTPSLENNARIANVLLDFIAAVEPDAEPPPHLDLLAPLVKDLGDLKAIDLAVGADGVIGLNIEPLVMGALMLVEILLADVASRTAADQLVVISAVRSRLDEYFD